MFDPLVQLKLSYHSVSEVPSFEVLLQQFTEVEIVGCKVQIEYWMGKPNPAGCALGAHNSAAPKESIMMKHNLSLNFSSAGNEQVVTAA